MLLTKNNIKLVFGLKLKQMRQDKNLSLSELAKKSGLSVSYLTEIESGKKYPKSDKIAALSSALGVTYDKLVSLKLTKNLAPLGELLESNILEQLPLDHYGIDIGKLIVLLSNAPLQLSALVATLIDMARSSEMSQNNFSRTALRTYKEFNENYFVDIEKAVASFVKENKFSQTPPVSYSKLSGILKNNYNYLIDDKHLNSYPGLAGIRGVFVPGKTKHLLINEKLSDAQKAFIAGKEIAYNYLGIKDRTQIYSDSSVDSFDQLLNNLRASYFSTALLVGKDMFIRDLNELFKNKKWSSSRLLNLIKKYNVSPEVFIQRLTNIASKFLNLNSFYFLRFNTRAGSGEYQLTKEMRLNTNENPGGYQSLEHYCRRWVSISVLKELERKQSAGNKFISPVIGVQNSKFHNSGNLYFNISIARSSRLNPGSNTSVTIGFLVDDEFKARVNFWDDPKIPVKEVNDTCERCLIENCKERVSPPLVAESRQKEEQIKDSLSQLISALIQE